MLDVTTYRMYHELAKSQMPSWRLYQRHQVEFFPVSMLPQLRAMLDTMHEGRFDGFMRELGGFTPEELSLFLSVCRKHIEFQMTHFPNLPPVVPLNNLIATFCIYTKINALKPGFHSLLEIGPGCGYFPFFLQGNHSALRNYSAIEAAESFYLLQHHVGEYVYGSQFDQKVYPDHDMNADIYGAEFLKLKTEIAERADVMTFVPPKNKIMHHYPWWRIGELISSTDRFDLVMSNANLMEFSTVTLKDYLALIQTKLAPDGLFFVQCFGGGVKGGPDGISAALKILYEFGFAPLFLALKDDFAKKSPVWRDNNNYMQVISDDPRVFALSNAVFINKRHELYSQYYRRENFRNYFFAPLPNIRDAFFGNPKNRCIYNRKELLKILSDSYTPEKPGGTDSNFQQFFNDFKARETASSF